jgi:pyridoxamine 5'-phosphate oxidase family protein
MSNFTQAEISYLQTPQLGRLATVGPDGQPHVVPVGYRYNEAEDTIDIGGRGFATSKKYRDMLNNPRVALVVDEIVSIDPWRIRGIEVRGLAEVLPNGGKDRGPAFDDAMIRIRPRRIVSWGLEEGTTGPFARSVEHSE